MPAFAAAGAGFLLAVLWFDLMFDVQVRKHPTGVLPDETLASIAAYYRRVTTDAAPMSLLVSSAMLFTLASLVIEIANRSAPVSIAAASTGLVAAAIGIAGSRTVKNAKRLGARGDTLEEQTRLARLIYKDHRVCFALVAAVIGLQLSSVVWHHAA
jgi:hypothetical protein